MSTSNNRASAGLRGNHRLLFGVILGARTFWVFAQAPLPVPSGPGAWHR